MQPRKDWYNGIWFAHATPKYSFLAWLAILNRLLMGDRMKTWNTGIQSDCVLCQQDEETRSHMFFACGYTKVIWCRLTSRLLSHKYTSDWENILQLLNDKDFDKITLFLIRYVFQSTIYHIWRERNCRRHGKTPLAATTLIKLIEKNVRNRLSSIRATGNNAYREDLCKWFAAQAPSPS